MPKIRVRRRRVICLTVLGVLIATGVASLAFAYLLMFRMPGKSYSGGMRPLGETEWVLSQVLHNDVRVLAEEIGERNTRRPEALARAADFITTSLEAKRYPVKRHAYEVDGVNCENIEAEFRGSSTPDQIVVVGAHYDSVPGTVGANDNGSGVAGVLALARMFAEETTPACTIRFVCFVNEEPPYFMTPNMGSYVYAKRCRERGDNITAMLSLETIGYYSEAPGSQTYPNPVLETMYPDKGNFIAIVGDMGAGELVRRCVEVFRATTEFPAEGTAIPAAVPGVQLSDHWSFSQFDYPAVMFTDTAPYRYPHYHTVDDTPDKIDFERMARVVGGTYHVVRALANSD